MLRRCLRPRFLPEWLACFSALSAMTCPEPPPLPYTQPSHPALSLPLTLQSGAGLRAEFKLQALPKHLCMRFLYFFLSTQVNANVFFKLCVHMHCLGWTSGLVRSHSIRIDKKPDCLLSCSRCGAAWRMVRSLSNTHQHFLRTGCNRHVLKMLRGRSMWKWVWFCLQIK